MRRAREVGEGLLHPERAAPHVREFIGKRLVPLETVEAALQSPSSNYLSDPHAIIEATQPLIPQPLVVVNRPGAA